MNTRKQHIFFLVAKLPLLLLYTSFFIVQLFFNFDIASRVANNNIFLQQGNTHAASQASPHVKKSSLPSDNKVSFRLNKRYHPQPAIGCNTIIIKSLVCYVSSKQHVHYSSGFIPAALPSAHSLRGPPAVV